MAKKKIDFGKVAVNAMSATAGGVGARVIQQKVLPDDMNKTMKSAIPAIAGLALPMLFQENEMIDNFGQGMTTVALTDMVTELTMGNDDEENSEVGNLYQQYELGNLSKEYAMLGAGKYDELDQFAEYEESVSMNGVNDAANSLSGINDDAANSLSGFDSRISVPWGTSVNAAMNSIM